MGKQRVVLKHHADLPLIGRQIRDQLIFDEDLAVVRLREPRDQVQQRGLAAAGRPQQRQEFTAPDLQRQLLQHRLLTVLLDHSFQAHRAGRFWGHGAVLHGGSICCAMLCRIREAGSAGRLWILMRSIGKNETRSQGRLTASDLLFPKPSVQKTKLSSAAIWLTLRRIDARMRS
ncbi:hypothetical protein D3C73_1099930 [compost metagenome]